MTSPLLASARQATALLALLAALAASPALAAGPLDRAREAQARGDLRAAQIESRNAVRANPNSAEARAALAAASLDLGDGDTAETAARAALERGYDPVAGTALLLRSYASRGRFRELLRDFPPIEDPARAAVAGQVAAARAIAHFSQGEIDAARQSVSDALRLAPSAVEPHVAAASLALADNDRAAAEAALGRALALNPDAPDALFRKGGLQSLGGDFAAAAEIFGRIISAAPGNVNARLARAEAMLRTGDEAQARQDVEAAIKAIPGHAGANYLRAVLLVRERNWRAADETLQRLGAALTNFPDGLLMRATVKRALGQLEQADDAARRHFARRPDDPRGAKLLATIEMEAGRSDAAVGTLGRLVARGAADVEAFDMLARAHTAAGRPREAAEALQRAVDLAPDDAGILSRLAASRLATGDTFGTSAAAQEALLKRPGQRGAREILVAAALARGDLALAEEELSRLDAAARRAEPVRMLDGVIRLGRLDLAGAATAFEAALRENRDSIPARLGLARVAAARGAGDELVRLLREVLRRDAGNAEATNRLASMALSGGPVAPQALAALESAHASAPGRQSLALAFATVLLRRGDANRAAAVLEAEPLRSRPGLSNGALPLLLAEARLANGQLAEAETANRAALAEAPESLAARRQLVALLLRRGDAPAAEALVQEALQAQPGDASLQRMLVSVVQQARGLDAALEVADLLARQLPTRLAAGMLRGDLLLGARRPEEAVRAYATAYAAAPSAVLAMRQAAAWQAANRPAEAESVLKAWLQREPADPAVLGALAQIDILAGRSADAERRLADALERAPTDAVSMNNLAWLVNQRDGPEAAARARTLAERAYFLMPNATTADTLGWVLVRNGEARLALPLLRSAVVQTRNRAMAYRLAYALRATGERQEAARLLERVVDGEAPFPERAEAERLLAELRADAGAGR